MMRPAPWVLVLCVLVFCDAANAANWNITPRLRLGGSYSDNILLRENNKEGDFVARIVPGLSVRGRGGRLQMNLDYNLENLFYEADSSRDQTNHQFQGNATAELWRNRLFLDARGRVSQQLVDNQGRFTNSNLSITGNRADAVTYSFAPYFIHHFGSWADANIRYEFSDVTNKRNVGLDSEIDVITATLNSGRKFYRIPWGLTFRSREVSRSSGAEASFDSLRLNTSYRFSRKYQIDVTAGIEDNKFNTIENNVDGFYWTIGGTWTPSRRTQASFAMGERFFGTTMRASARHDRRRLSLSVDYNETPQTVNEQQALQRLIPLADENGEPIFDPDFVGDFDLEEDTTSLNNDVFVQKRLAARARYTRRRDTLTANFNDTSREYQTARGDESTTRLGAAWTRRMSHLITAGLRFSWQKNDFDLGNRNDKRISIRPFMRYRFGDSMTGTLEYQYIDNNSNTNANDFTENRLNAFLNFHL